MFKKITRRFFLFFLIIILSSLCIPVRSYAASESKIIKVGYYENEVFEEGASDDSIKAGYAYEYYRKLSEFTGWKYEYIYGDFVDIYNMLLDGEVDMVAGLAFLEEREDMILYPDRPMGTESYSLVKHEDDDTISTHLTSLNGKKIGVLDSAIKNKLIDFLSEKKINSNIITYTSYDALFAAFDKKDIDVMAAETDGTNSRTHAEILSSFGSSDYYLCVSKNNPKLLKELNAAQEQLYYEDPNYISLLRNKYYASSLTSRAFSEAEKEWIAENTELSVGYLENYLPYSDTDKDGNVTGFVKDLVPEIFKNLSLDSVKVSYQGYQDYDDLTEALSKGEIDVAFPVGGGLFYSEEDGLYLTSAVTSTAVNLIYSDDFISASNADFAINRNNKMQYYFVKTHYPDSTITYFDSTKDCLTAVLDGKVKCTTLNGLRTNTLLKNRAYRLLSFRQLPYTDDRCFGVKIGNEGLLKLLNRGMSVTGQEFSLNLAYQYSEGLAKYTLADMFFDNIWAIFVFALLILAVILFFSQKDRHKSLKAVKEKEKARIEMEKANISKTLFLNRLSEDMHNSVDSIIDYANIAGKDKSGRTDEYLGKIKDLSSHLLWLIDDVHDFSSVESGHYNSNDQNLKFRQFILDIKEATSENIEEILSAYDFSGNRTLIVDSITSVRNNVAALLKKTGFEVQVANDGTDAVNKIVAAPAGYFDLLIIDIQTPNVDGYEASRQIRNLGNSEKARIPIVAVSGDEFKNIKEVNK
ncbi:transporter substrate-binding domain-containing protein [Butyrivibrio sp. XBB1001]|uniref:transporter substrate-binding domain-containing protein n=1 Tax=Butyrivibrio sp. XBB1001 TaxID=1280682 RepID=UPI0003FA981D|nr:transporter substrate-binding domain-containing protein [Butyrivibrio sp. XBB1001]